ncbi:MULTISPECIES: hypothetical protein [unclassified Pseudomonas]|uniref:hypothetical protein n=1 Tax=unclassified Pseudomonas TaxID=196821 RepID=UPI000BD3AE29|nr:MULTISPECIES: hypothetical protein [unclassified Pseudomonas]PVZ19566.1 hypothetical protein F474_00153 [Pseudomonas sp. URIL14HWK12:I12]PVZ22849.1 hypothetical protein F470_03347 [Pseudomonas sp. URIL14HWK12:I10]PVZ37521.1 hypothetical protein F472_00153 [Pseudomonas sp. URIL14HWK12:I11]SNZ14992.1 hypothetical protein SAMN05660463_02947 [Pseudomonas sp. URIL14HWK12:I9]
MTRSNEPNQAHNAPPTDTQGKPVDVVEKAAQKPDGPAKDFDKVITPAGNAVKDEDAKALNRKIDEVEQKLRNTP